MAERIPASNSADTKARIPAAAKPALGDTAVQHAHRNAGKKVSNAIHGAHQLKARAMLMLGDQRRSQCRLRGLDDGGIYSAQSEEQNQQPFLAIGKDEP